jgi:hypothetical protein
LKEMLRIIAILLFFVLGFVFLTLGALDFLTGGRFDHFLLAPRGYLGRFFGRMAFLIPAWLLTWFFYASIVFTMLFDIIMLFLILVVFVPIVLALMFLHASTLFAAGFPNKFKSAYFDREQAVRDRMAIQSGMQVYQRFPPFIRFLVVVAPGRLGYNGVRATINLVPDLFTTCFDRLVSCYQELSMPQGVGLQANSPSGPGRALSPLRSFSLSLPPPSNFPVPVGGVGPFDTQSRDPEENQETLAWITGVFTAAAANLSSFEVDRAVQEEGTEYSPVLGSPTVLASELTRAAFAPGPSPNVITHSETVNTTARPGLLTKTSVPPPPPPPPASVSLVQSGDQAQVRPGSSRPALPQSSDLLAGAARLRKVPPPVLKAPVGREVMATGNDLVSALRANLTGRRKAMADDESSSGAQTVFPPSSPILPQASVVTQPVPPRDFKGGLTDFKVRLAPESEFAYENRVIVVTSAIIRVGGTYVNGRFVSVEDLVRRGCRVAPDVRAEMKERCGL